MLSEDINFLSLICLLLFFLSLSFFLIMGPVNTSAQYGLYPSQWQMPYPQPYSPYPQQYYPYPQPYSPYPQPYSPYPQQYYPYPQPYSPYPQPYSPYPQQYYPYPQPYSPYPQQYYPYPQQYSPYPQQYYPYPQPYSPYPQQYYPYSQPYTQYPQQYYPYSQQYPYSYPYVSYQPQYTDADLDLDSSDDGDDFTVDKGDTISIILSSNLAGGYLWSLDTDDLDEDIVSKTSNQSFPAYAVGVTGTEQWLFEAEDVGTTTIKLNYRGLYQTAIQVQDTFEVEITVED